VNNYQFRTLILPADCTQTAATLAAGTDPAGVNMWTTGLSPSGTEPATHYISTGMLGAQFAALLPLQDPETGEVLSPGLPDTLAALVLQAGLTITGPEIAALFAAADVTTQDPHEALARLGLQLIQPAP
jgi:hypothetical protein